MAVLSPQRELLGELLEAVPGEPKPAAQVLCQVSIPARSCLGTGWRPFLSEASPNLPVGSKQLIRV